MPRTRLSPAQIEQYNTDGFIIIRNFLAADEIEAWRCAFRRNCRVFSSDNHFVLPVIFGGKFGRSDLDAAVDDR